MSSKKAKTYTSEQKAKVALEGVYLDMGPNPTNFQKRREVSLKVLQFDE